MHHLNFDELIAFVFTGSLAAIYFVIRYFFRLAFSETITILVAWILRKKKKAILSEAHKVKLILRRADRKLHISIEKIPH